MQNTRRTPLVIYKKSLVLTHLAFLRHPNQICHLLLAPCLSPTVCKRNCRAQSFNKLTLVSDSKFILSEMVTVINFYTI